MALSAANRDMVVIGGSAGSTGPLKKILAALPGDLPAVVAVVLHMPMKSRGIFATISSFSTELRMKHAEDGEELMRGTVYFAQPNHHLLLIDGRVRLGAGPRENSVRPAIDPLFRSAALSYGPRAVAVILSGMLNDGASGMAAIKQCGGMALVQAPQDASASEMPLAALQASPVDRSTNAAGLAGAIVEMVRQPPDFALPPPADIALEVEIAAGYPIDMDRLNRITKPSVVTCPDCGGVLSEVQDARPLRFRCRVGHAFTGEALFDHQESQVDEAMRVALRIVEERASLIARMGKDAASAGRTNMSEIYEERAAEYRTQAEVLREAVLRQLDLRKAAENDARMRAAETAEARGPVESSEL